MPQKSIETSRLVFKMLQATEVARPARFVALLGELLPDAELNLKLVNDQDEFIPDSTRWRHRPPTLSLFEYFLKYRYPLYLFDYWPVAEDLRQIFVENGARLPDVRGCNEIMADWAEYVTATDKFLETVHHLQEHCEGRASSAIRENPVFRSYVPGFMERAYHPQGRLAQLAWEEGERELLANMEQ
jgi:hypothetical protein